MRSVHRISISIEDLEGDLAERFKEIPFAVRRGMFDGLQFGRALLTKKSPTDQGQLRNSWQVRNFAGGVLGRDTMAELVNEAPHAGIVEGGARPHPVSREGIEAITQWVWRNRRSFNLARVQGPVQRTSKGGPRGGRRALQAASDMAQVQAIAFAIVWKIRKYGQKPTYFVRNSMPRISSQTRRETERAIDRLAGTRFR